MRKESEAQKTKVAKLKKQVRIFSSVHPHSNYTFAFCIVASIILMLLIMVNPYFLKSSQINDILLID